MRSTLCSLCLCGMKLFILYCSIVLLGAVLVLSRRETALLRGSRFFAFTVAFFLAAAVSGTMMGFWVGALLVSLLASGEWFLLRNDPQRTASALERSLAMLLIPFEKVETGYLLRLGSDAASINLFSILPWCSILTFRGERGHKKVRLLRALLAKKFRPVFPRPTIDLR